MKKVLVAEDEESIREFIVINLTRSGYNVEQAENGAVALEKFSQDETGFDVAILDIMMPELDGLLFVRNFANVQVIWVLLCLVLKLRKWTRLRVLCTVLTIMLLSRFHQANLWQGLTLFTEE